MDNEELQLKILQRSRDRFVELANKHIHKHHEDWYSAFADGMIGLTLSAVVDVIDKIIEEDFNHKEI